MVVLIFIKWSLPWSQDPLDYYYVGKAPSIITIFIKMALSPGKWDPVNINLFFFIIKINRHLEYHFMEMRQEIPKH